MRFIQERESQIVEAGVEAGEGFRLVRGVWRASELGVEQQRRMTDSVHGKLPEQAEPGETNVCLAPAV